MLLPKKCYKTNSYKRAATGNESKKSIITKKTSYKTYIIKEILLPGNRLKTKVINVLLPGAKAKEMLLLKQYRTKRIL